MSLFPFKKRTMEDQLPVVVVQVAVEVELAALLLPEELVAHLVEVELAALRLEVLAVLALGPVVQELVSEQALFLVVLS